MHLEDMIKNFEPLDATADTYLGVSTEQSEEGALHAILSRGRALRQAQARELIRGLDEA